jgi:hypothetical protein
MPRIVTVELLREGDRFEFLTARSEWADHCFLPHPQGVIVVAKTAYLDHYQQCRFGWRLEKFPHSKPQDWWGHKHVEVRLLEKAAISHSAAKENQGPAKENRGPAKESRSPAAAKPTKTTRRAATRN